MQHQSNSHAWLRKRAITGAIATLLASLPAAAGANPPAANAQQTSGRAACCGATRVYSVINLGPQAFAAALLNERGQAAFGAIGYTGISNGFFDGDRLHNIGTLGGGYTWIWGLNKHGVVVGESEDGQERSNILGFTWTKGSGMRALPGTSVSSARAINDHNGVVGLTAAPGVSERAIRWNPNGTVTALGPLPFSLSQARAVNQGGIAAGFTDLANGEIHASQWDRAGNQTDLGSLGGQLAFGMHINDNNAVAGVSLTAGNAREIGFFWSRDSGMVPIDAELGGSRLVAGLNNRGEVAGIMTVGERSVAYQWSLARGVVELPSGSATRSDVFDINNNGEMVGLIERRAADGGGVRAVRWPALTTPIDLNTRLHRPPAGLVLEIGAAINDDGVILAHSNAGLVLLRPGTSGTDAPVLGPFVGFPDVLEVGQHVALTIGFVDNNGAETHNASAAWNDGCASPAPTVKEARGVGEVRLHHRFCSAGFFQLKAQVADSGGRSTQLQRDIVVEAPGLASVSGAGTLSQGAALGARHHQVLPLRFVLWAPLDSAAARAAASGKPVLILSGPFHFRSDKMTATAAGQQARIEGTGELNGRPGYRVLLEARNGSARQGTSLDRLRIRVTHVDAGSGAEVADYDNGAPAAALAAARSDASVVIEGRLRLRH